MQSTSRHKCDIKKENIQLSTFTSNHLDIVTIYKYQQEVDKNLLQAIQLMTQSEKAMLLIGDFNFGYLDGSTSSTEKYMKNNKFKQLINEPTHIEGNILDQAHFRDTRGTIECRAEVQSKYYTDHKSLNIITRKKGNFMEI